MSTCGADCGVCGRAERHCGDFLLLPSPCPLAPTQSQPPLRTVVQNTLPSMPSPLLSTNHFFHRHDSRRRRLLASKVALLHSLHPRSSRVESTPFAFETCCSCVRARRSLPSLPLPLKVKSNYFATSGPVRSANKLSKRCYAHVEAMKRISQSSAGFSCSSDVQRGA